MAHEPILLVDDDENDLLLIGAAFEKAQFDSPLQTVRDGQKAIDYMKRAISDGEQEVPCAVLLDLNMPRKGGFEVLAWARIQPQLATVPFIVLTASLRSQDVQRAYELGAYAFLVKPTTLHELIRVLTCLREWLQINHFPPGTRGAHSG